jgi:hypothetical protein
MAWCAVAQNGHEFRRDVTTAITSRSPTVHAEGPRIVCCTSAWKGVPK